MLSGSNAHFILTREKKEAYENGLIDIAFLQKNISDFKRHFYICGPDKMIHDINAALEKSGASADLVVFEK